MLDFQYSNTIPEVEHYSTRKRRKKTAKTIGITGFFQGERIVRPFFIFYSHPKGGESTRLAPGFPPPLSQPYIEAAGVRPLPLSAPFFRREFFQFVYTNWKKESGCLQQSLYAGSRARAYGLGGSLSSRPAGGPVPPPTPDAATLPGVLAAPTDQHPQGGWPSSLPVYRAGRDGCASRGTTEAHRGASQVPPAGRLGPPPYHLPSSGPAGP